jgi:hypothetical protein
VFGAIPILMPLTEPGPRLVLFPIAVAGLSFTVVLYNIAQLSYRQLICPPELLGRMNAAMRWIVWGTIPLGGLLGGVLGSLIGIRPALWVAVVGSWAAAFWVFFSPLRKMRDIPSETIRGSATTPAQPADAVPASAAADAQQGQNDEHDRRGGEHAVTDHDGDRKVPLRRNG